MKNNGFKIDLPQQAIDHYNHKADELLFQLEILKPASSPDTISSSNSHLYTQTVEAKDIANLSISSIDGFGDMKSKYFHTAKGQVGLDGNNYEECRKIIEELSWKNGIKEIVSYDYIHACIFEWFSKKYTGEIKQSTQFLSYLATSLDEVIKEYKIAIPISFLSIEKGFNIGKIEFDFFKENLFDEYEENFINNATNENEIKMMKQAIINLRKKYQGKVSANITLIAEQNKAIEIAKEETENSLTILKIFSPPAFLPELTSFIGRMGQIMMPESHIFIFEDILPEIRSSFDIKHSPNWHITNQEIARLRSHGIENFGKLIPNEENTELEYVIFRSIYYFSKAISCTDYYDRLVHLITSIELLLLKDRSEKIGDNIERRLAILSGESVESRSDVAKLLSKAYDRRAFYLHHGGKRSVLDILKKLQLIIWSGIYKAVIKTSDYKTKLELINFLDMKIPFK